MVLAARRRGRFVRDADVALVEDILFGRRTTRELPACVLAALAALEQRPQRDRVDAP